MAHWPALTRWRDDEYLAAAGGESLVTVALTPNGRADAVTPLPAAPAPPPRSSPAGSVDPAQESCAQPSGSGGGAAGTGELPLRGECFTLPHQERMTLRDFLHLLQASRAAASNGSNTGGGGASTSSSSDSTTCAGNTGGGNSMIPGPGVENGQQQQRQPQQQSHHHQHHDSHHQHQGPQPCIVPYLQFQNSSLTTELPQLLADSDPDLPWATEALGEGR